MLKRIFDLKNNFQYISISAFVFLLSVLFSGTAQAKDENLIDKKAKSTAEVKIAKNKSVDPYADMSHIERLSNGQLNLGAINISNEGIIKLRLKDKKTLVLDKGENQTSIGAVRVDERKGIWLHKNKKWLQALWWEKTDTGKKLKIKVSDDEGKTFSKDAALIAKQGVLPEISIADDGEDRFAVAYISERRPGYQLYFNRTLDGGHTWLDDDVRINDLFTSKGKVVNLDKPLKDQSKIGSQVSTPLLTYINNTLVLVWQETFFENGKFSLRIVSKQSKDFGDTWEEKEVFSMLGVSPQEMSVSRAGNEIFISVWIPTKGLHTFVSKKDLSGWDALGIIPNTKDLTFTSQMTYALTKQGKDSKRVLSFTGRDRIEIEKVYFFIQNELNEKQWTDTSAQITAKSISKVKAENEFNYKSNNAVISSLGESAIFVAWEDHRFHVPTILLNYSLDGGDSWLKKPLFINRPGKNFQRYPHFISDKQSLWLEFTQSGFKSSDMDNPRMYISEIARLAKGNEVSVTLSSKALENTISNEDKLKLLTKRANELWDLRIKKKYAQTFKYFDPLYRSMFNMQSFAAGQGKIQFKDYELGNTELSEDGLSAVMDTDLTVSLIMFVSLEPDSETKDPTPPKKYKMKAKWGWYYDNWYLMPETLFDRRRQF